MKLRTAGPGDAAAIAAIWAPIIRDTTVTFTTEMRSEDALAELIAARAPAFLVAEEAGQVAGFTSYGAFRAGPGYARTVEHTVILDASARGRGLGRALMSRLQDVARAAGHHVMVGGISAENPGAIAFHERIGFARVGLLPQVGHKFGRWLDLVLVQKIL